MLISLTITYSHNIITLPIIYWAPTVARYRQQVLGGRGRAKSDTEFFTQWRWLHNRDERRARESDFTVSCLLCSLPSSLTSTTRPPQTFHLASLHPHLLSNASSLTAVPIAPSCLFQVLGCQGWPLSPWPLDETLGRSHYLGSLLDHKKSSSHSDLQNNLIRY